jgi:hypothetical protein
MQTGALALTKLPRAFVFAFCVCNFFRSDELKATFAAQLARCRKLVLHGKRVRRAPKRRAPPQEEEAEEEDGDAAEDAGGDDDDAFVDDGEEEGGAVGPQRGDITQRPSYVAWHTAPAAQRFGRFRHAHTHTHTKKTLFRSVSPRF